MIIYTITIEEGAGGIVQTAMSPDNRAPSKREIVVGAVIDIALKTAGEILMLRQGSGSMLEGEGVEAFVARIVKEQIAKAK